MLTIFKDIRKSLALSLLKAAAKRKRTGRQTITFAEAKKIGVVFSADAMSDMELIKQFITDIEKNGKKVISLGYVTIHGFEKNNSHNFSEFDFFYPKDLTYLYKPKGNNVKRFIRTEFDILICLNHQNIFTLNYIAALSRAKFRIGQYHANFVQSYDFMIDTKSNSVDLLMAQINHYLSIIKK